MGAYLVFGVLGVPCVIFLLWCLTPSGRRWLKSNNML